MIKDDAVYSKIFGGIECGHDTQLAGPQTTKESKGDCCLYHGVVVRYVAFIEHLL